jgi:hypothetical protein
VRLSRRKSSRIRPRVVVKNCWVPGSNVIHYPP